MHFKEMAFCILFFAFFTKKLRKNTNIPKKKNPSGHEIKLMRDHYVVFQKEAALCDRDKCDYFTDKRPRSWCIFLRLTETGRVI